MQVKKNRILMHHILREKKYYPSLFLLVSTADYF
jgi:hypothetical protein